MSKLKTAVAAAATVIALTGASYAQTAAQREDIGGWVVETLPKPGEKLDPLCILYSPVDNGTSIKFHNPRGAGPTVRGKGFFQVYTNNIISDAQKTTLPDASIRIDGVERWKKDVTWQKISDDRGVLSVQLDDKIDALIRPFSSGRTTEVVVSTPDGKEHSFEVKLAGSFRAFTAYEKCLAKVHVASE